MVSPLIPSLPLIMHSERIDIIANCEITINVVNI